MTWISVNDQRPKEGEPFLGTDREVMFVAQWSTSCHSYYVGGWESCNYCGGESRISLDEEEFTVRKVSHWMPLPSIDSIADK